MPRAARALASSASSVMPAPPAPDEPAPGAGSDPTALRTTATKTADGWRIDGEKWFITGALGASLMIVMARTSERGATMFLVDADHPGIEIAEVIDTIDKASPGGHSRIVFDNCVVGEERILGAVDKGFEYAQVRLAPARLGSVSRCTAGFEADTTG